MSLDKITTANYRVAEGSEMIRLMRQGVVDALREHKRLGNSVVVWDRESGQIVQVEPDEIVVPEDNSDPAATVLH